ncbi:MAG: NAD-dependent epimerase/dehydratase family protein [Bradyrhizobium sp.]|uniref:NAD-dependent epimerase/dehydratase family protein n=1 Tax=Bradyrhizobium sp. TaxID=376 RepID=UPI001DCA0678|nr:NAD-dependent epimerase/dehydratase family protein [Bradyrhizobium sp.]MBV9563237.1 NAD-dependent epimerase/dehydratase family protein [Bradyrhizobium sp.]
MEEGRKMVLVTGANGFVGRHLAPVLARQGWTVRRAMRRAAEDDHEGVVAVDTVGPTTDWGAALEGVEAVVHLAARVHHQHEEHAVRLYRSVNIEGTLHLARSALKAGVRKFVFVSTVLVHGRSNHGRAPFSENDVLTPKGLYGMSKAAAEAGLKTLAMGGDMAVTVIRPPLVYGSGAKGNFAMLLKAVRLGIPLPFAAIDNHRAFLSIENLTSFIAWRLSVEAGKFDVFLVADKEQISTPDFIARIARAAGVKSLLFPLPIPLLSLLLKTTGRQDAHDSLLGSLELDLSKLATIDWQPPVNLDEGLQRALTASDV